MGTAAWERTGDEEGCQHKVHKSGRGKEKAILTAMCREFMNIPYSEIRISSLIQKAGISRASFYLYFDDKEDLLNCIAESWVDAILKHIADAFRKADGSYYDGMKF